MRVSYFETIHDAKPQEDDLQWDDIVSLIKNPEVRETKDGKLFSPAVYSLPRRAKENVREISMLCLDIDRGMAFSEAFEILADVGLQAAIHTTYSHARKCKDNPDALDRFRIIFPLKEPIGPDEYPDFWNWGRRLFKDQVDKAAKDTCRIFYMPALVEDCAPYNCHFFKGEALSREQISQTGQVPDDVPIEFESNEKYAQTAFDAEVDRVRTSSKGEKHNALNRASFSLGTLIGAGVLTQSDVERDLESAAISVGFTTKEARRVIRDGINAGLKAPRDLPDHVKPGARGPQVPQWEEPPALTKTKTETFPLDSFPLWISSFIREVSRSTQTPEDMTAVFCLGALAGLVAPHLRLRVRGDWFENLNLYLLAALPPGHRKSAVHNLVLKPIHDIEESIMNSERARVAAERAEREATEAQFEHLRRSVGRLQGDEFLRMKDQMALLAVKLANWPAPRVRRLTADDVTPETLASLLADQGGSMMILSAEGDQFNIMAGRYSHGAGNFNVFLKAHNGDPMRVDRRERSEIIPSPRLTLALAVQPDVLRAAAARTEFRDRGLLARFLFVQPPSLLGYRDIAPEPADQAVLDDWRRGIWRLYEAQKDGDLIFSGRAMAVFTDFEAEIEGMLRSESTLGDVVDWGAKLAGHTARIAALLHLAEHRDALDPWPDQIHSKSVVAAVAIARSLITHALAVFESVEEGELLRQVKRVLLQIRKFNMRVFTIRELARRQHARFRIVSRLKPILGVLIEQGWISLNGRTGIYEANARIWTMTDVDEFCRHVSTPVDIVSTLPKSQVTPSQSSDKVQSVDMSTLDLPVPGQGGSSAGVRSNVDMSTDAPNPLVNTEDNPDFSNVDTMSTDVDKSRQDEVTMQSVDVDNVDSVDTSSVDTLRKEECQRVVMSILDDLEQKLALRKLRREDWMAEGEDKMWELAGTGDLEEVLKLVNKYRMKMLELDYKKPGT